MVRYPPFIRCTHELLNAIVPDLSKPAQPSNCYWQWRSVWWWGSLQPRPKALIRGDFCSKSVLVEKHRICVAKLVTHLPRGK